MQTTWAYISNYFVYSAMAVFTISFIAHAFETAFAVRAPEVADTTDGSLLVKTLDYKRTEKAARIATAMMISAAYELIVWLTSVLTGEAAEAAEDVELDADFKGQTFTRIDQTIALGALFTAHHLNANAIAALTDSGSTAIWMSRHNIHVPIFALTSKIATQRALSTYRNVTPIGLDYTKDRDTALQEVEACLKKMGAVKKGDTVVLTSGEPMGEPGGTNTLKIVHVK